MKEGVDASARAILEHITLVALVNYLETAISIKTFSSLYSSLLSSLSLIDSISKPTTDNLLFNPHRFCISSTILWALRIHSFPFDWKHTRANYECTNPKWACPKLTLGNSPVEYVHWSTYNCAKRVVGTVLTAWLDMNFFLVIDHFRYVLLIWQHYPTWSTRSRKISRNSSGNR